MDDVEVNDRRMATQLQMVLDEQKTLIFSYYDLDSKFKDMAKENKALRQDYSELKKRIDLANVPKISAPTSLKWNCLEKQGPHEDQ